MIPERGRRQYSLRSQNDTPQNGYSLSASSRPMWGVIDELVFGANAGWSRGVAGARRPEV